MPMKMFVRIATGVGTPSQKGGCVAYLMFGSWMRQ